MTNLENSISGKKIMITGGLGMIGSTIAHKLVRLGADVTIVDSCISPFGANLFNIEEIKDSINVNIADIRDKEAIKYLVQDKDIIFNLAGQVSHNDSIDNPFLDADINYIGHLNVLENLKRFNQSATVIHAGSRLQFGRLHSIPVKENHPLEPLTPYALNKTAAENMYRFYFQVFGIKCVLFRIANPYGIRSQMQHSKYSILNWFIRMAMEGKTIKVFGDGAQIRDYIYVDDLADAFIMASVSPQCAGEVINIGSGTGVKFRDMVEAVIDIVGNGKVEYVPWPSNYINVETGDHVTDITKLCDTINWSPSTNLETGIEKTSKYYKEYCSHYW